MTEPLVSIITPTYNCEDFISDTIESVINQTYKNWELLLVDDCSTDRTLEITNQWVRKDQRIMSFTLDENSGSGPARI